MGKQLLKNMTKSLAQEYRRGYSVSNLNDMICFYEVFQILHAVLAESSEIKICQTLSGKSTSARILQAVSVEASDCILCKMWR